MFNIDTHLLIEPNFDNEEEITSIDDFVKKLGIFKDYYDSIKIELPDLDFLTPELKENSMSLEIPKNFTPIKLERIKQFSNSEELIELENESNKIFDDLTKNIDKELEPVKFSKALIESKCQDLSLLTKDLPKEPLYTFRDLATFNKAVSIVTEDQIKSNEILNGMLLYDIENHTEVLDELFEPTDSEEVNELTKKLINTIFKIIKVGYKLVIETKLFWCRFFELIFSEEKNPEIYEVDCDTLPDLEMILDVDDEDDMEFSGEFDIGTEASGLKTTGNFGSNPLSSAKKNAGIVADFFKKLPGKVNRINKQFKMFRMKAKNHRFYMKYIGRIEGLYERYADEAQIRENPMKGDPVSVLKEEAKDYVVNLSDEFTTLQSNILDTIKKISTMTDPKVMMSYVSKYCGMYAKEIEKPNDIPNAMIRASRFKIAEMIFKNNKVYGYTSEGIVENGKIPPANHTMVSLFVDRPDEKPQDLNVSDIFKSVDSFKLIAKNEKEPIFETTTVCNDLVSKGILAGSMKEIKNYKKNSYKLVKMNLDKLVETEEDNKRNKAKRELTNQCKQIWKGFEKAVNYVVKQKGYIADLINAYFIMMTRIDNLCKQCLVSLLNVERFKKDDRYGTGFDADKKNDNNKYKQNKEDNYKNKAEKEAEKDQDKSDRASEYSEKRNEIREKINAIRQTMRHV